MSQPFTAPVTLAPASPAQDIRPLNEQLISSRDPIHQNQGQIFNTLQEYIDATNSDVSDVKTLLNSFISYATGPSFSAAGYFNAGSGTTLTPDFNNGHTQVLTLTGSGTIHAALNAAAGDEIVIVLIQDATGGRQVTSWDASYLFPGTFGLDPTPATASVFTFRVNGTGNLFLKSAPLTGIPWS